MNIIEINDVTLTVDLGTWGHIHLLCDLAQLWLFASYKLDLGVDSNISDVEYLNNLKINNLLDLEIEGPVHFCMTFSV